MRGNAHNNCPIIILIALIFHRYSFALVLALVICAGDFPLGRRIPIALPNTGALARKRNSFYLRAILVICLVLFAVLQLHLINSRKYRFKK